MNAAEFVKKYVGSKCRINDRWRIESPLYPEYIGAYGTIKLNSEWLDYIMINLDKSRKHLYIKYQAVDIIDEIEPSVLPE